MSLQQFCTPNYGGSMLPYGNCRIVQLPKETQINCVLFLPFNCAATNTTKGFKINLFSSPFVTWLMRTMILLRWWYAVCLCCGHSVGRRPSQKKKARYNGWYGAPTLQNILWFIDEESAWHFLCVERSLMSFFPIALECSIWRETMKTEPMSYIEGVNSSQNYSRRVVTKSLNTVVISGSCTLNECKILKIYVLGSYRNIIWLSASWYLSPNGFAIDS